MLTKPILVIAAIERFRDCIPKTSMVCPEIGFGCRRLPEPKKRSLLLDLFFSNNWQA